MKVYIVYFKKYSLTLHFASDPKSQRYISHFRSVHRGAYFAELRTTTVRKLLPESWGFMCPVHTPDGSPCGLLNHLAASCYVHVGSEGIGEARNQDRNHVLKVLSSAGALLLHGRTNHVSSPPGHLAVMLDGLIVGYVADSDSMSVVSALRAAKVTRSTRVSSNLEIAHVPLSSCGYGGAFPGLYLFLSSSRMMRPVRQRQSGITENIGSLEQAFMSIRCPDGIHKPVRVVEYTHEESEPGSILSVVASLTPWSDFNQSPRNMYQCQMGKQTMGIPLHSFCYRPDTKIYRLQTPQRPVAITGQYDRYHMDDYPLGTNAVVAVLAHTGYDMEDAMIVSKGAMERGLGHATLYKTENVTLVAGSEEMFGQCGVIKQKEESSPFVSTEKPPIASNIDADGAPRPGSIQKPGSTFCNVVNRSTGRPRLHKIKGGDDVIVDRVSISSGKASKGQTETKMSVTIRCDRNPIIGDKFSSRHGQKGVLSFLCAEEDLPYIEQSGARPDILINPHAFPSRMTIGMLLESMASKAGALDGRFIDASPFQAADDCMHISSPTRVYGELLCKHGYNYSGSETMVNGFTGEHFDVDIFVGLVYYQRLRHMVSDKFQVRSLGPNNPLTQQPIKGRKAGGGIRFGEMERDALLAHGTSYLIHDRLHACSDRHVTSLCTYCGSLLAPASNIQMASVHLEHAGGAGAGRIDSFDDVFPGKVSCRVCNTGTGVQNVALPFVFKYLAAELAAMNIRIGLEVGEGSE